MQCQYNSLFAGRILICKTDIYTLKQYLKPMQTAHSEKMQHNNHQVNLYPEHRKTDVISATPVSLKKFFCFFMR